LHAASHDCDFFVQDGGGVVDKEAANDLHPCQGEVKHVSHNDDEIIVGDGVEAFLKVQEGHVRGISPAHFNA